MLTHEGDSKMAGYGKQDSVRKVFLWGIAAIYLFAFSSLYVQIPGLYGRNGIMPAKIVLNEEYATAWDNFRNKPTLLWFVHHVGLDIETGMEMLCLVGMVVSLLSLSLESWRDSITFFILWFLYYSLYQVGQTFLWFQWDILLMETGFLTILVAPLEVFTTRQFSSSFHHHDGITLWLVKWLAFRLMFCSGVVKLNSQCPTWWGLTALDWHYESQCIPTPLAWYAHQLPSWFQRLSIVLVYVILIALSWLFFAPVRSLRIFSFYSQLFFQVLIILTGNYNFFNLLAVIVLLPIIDDEHLTAMLPSWLVPTSNVVRHGFSPPTWFDKIKKVLRKVVFVGVIGTIVYWMVQLFDLEFSKKYVVKSKITFSKAEFFDAIERSMPITIWIGLGSLCVEILRALIGCVMEKGLLTKVWSVIQWSIFSFAALGLFAISLVPYTDIDYAAQQQVWPVIKRIKHKMDYLELVHAYGLFRSMTGVGGRPEVIVEGSNSLNGPWKEYDFLYKPGILDKKLPIVAPHQPRLDWQMWFAALGSYNHNPWFVHMVYRLLQGKQEVLDLLDKNPFPRNPPQYIRASLYKYRYTRLHRNTSNVFEALHNAGLIRNWWKREYTSEYLPIVSLDEPSLVSWLNHYGYAKSDPWPEYPSGRLYHFIKYLRSIVRTWDPVMFILVLFLYGVLMSVIFSKLTTKSAFV